jgi:hypothetical protein
VLIASNFIYSFLRFLFLLNLLHEMLNNEFTNSWAVNSQDRLGNRPTGEAWNYDFQSYHDFDEEACVERSLIEGNTMEEGLAAWAAQVAGSSEDETMYYDIFQLAITDHANELLAAQRIKEDKALALKKRLDDSKKLLSANRQKLASGETAQMRAEEAARAAVLAASVQVAFSSPTRSGGMVSSSSSSSSAGSTTNLGERTSGQEKLYYTVDKVAVWADSKNATATIGSCLSLYRTVERRRLKRYMDHTGFVWTLENTLLIVEEDRLTVEDANMVTSTDQNYSLTFWSSIAGNPGLLDTEILERLLRVQFRATDATYLHYLMFYPCVTSVAKVQEKASHVLCLEAIQKIWWIFFGDAWASVLQPLLDRLHNGNLNPFFKVNTVQSSSHVMLTYQIQTAFATVGSLLRRNVPRVQCATEDETKLVLIQEIQDIFEKCVPPGNNTQVTSSRLSDFRESGKDIEVANIIKIVVARSPPKKLQGEKRGATERRVEPPLKLQRSEDSQVCLKNMMLQFFGRQPGLGELCPSPCPFKHESVGSINQTMFDKAVSAGLNLFGPIFQTGNWEKKLKTAFGGLDNNGHQHPILSPTGNPIKPRGYQGTGGRGGGRLQGGRGRGRGRNG